MNSRPVQGTQSSRPARATKWDPISKKKNFVSVVTPQWATLTTLPSIHKQFISCLVCNDLGVSTFSLCRAFLGLMAVISQGNLYFFLPWFYPFLAFHLPICMKSYSVWYPWRHTLLWELSASACAWTHTLLLVWFLVHVLSQACLSAHSPLPFIYF